MQRTGWFIFVVDEIFPALLEVSILIFSSVTFFSVLSVQTVIVQFRS